MSHLHTGPKLEWKINKRQAHTLLCALERRCDDMESFAIVNSLYTPSFLENWKQVLQNAPDSMVVTFSYSDMWFFDFVVGLERSHLKTGLPLECDHIPSDHLQALDNFFDNCIVPFLHIKDSLRFQEEHHEKVRRSDKFILVRHEVEAIIEEKVAKRREQLMLGDVSESSNLRTNPPDDWSEEELEQVLKTLSEMDHEGTLSDIRNQLWELYENKYCIVDVE